VIALKKTGRPGLEPIVEELKRLQARKEALQILGPAHSRKTVGAGSGISLILRQDRLHPKLPAVLNGSRALVARSEPTHKRRRA